MQNVVPFDWEFATAQGVVCIVYKYKVMNEVERCAASWDGTSKGDVRGSMKLPEFVCQ